MTYLTDLNPRWVGAGGGHVSDKDGNPIPERKGVGMFFNCPCGCKQRSFLYFENPTDGGSPTNGKAPTWKRTGDDFSNMTLTPSIRRTEPGGCGWHGFLTDGEFKSV